MTTATAKPATSHLTLGEVAELFRCTPQTVRRWLAEDRLPRPVRQGQRLLFDAAEVQAHLARLRA